MYVTVGQPFCSAICGSGLYLETRMPSVTESHLSYCMFSVVSIYSLLYWPFILSYFFAFWPVRKSHATISLSMREERLKAIMLACAHIPATGASCMYLFRNLIGSMPICSLPIGSLARRWFSYLSLGCKHRMCAGISSLWISPGNFWSCICFSLAYRICRIQYQCILFNLKERKNVKA